MPSSPPTIQTDRLNLRPFAVSDAPRIQQYLADPDVSRTTANIPHPYQPGMAKKWIRKQKAEFARGKSICFAIDRRSDDLLIGGICVRMWPAHQRGEIGYVIYKPYWNHGYATEATMALIRFGFQTLGLNRIEAHHFGNNPASGRVMAKAGMRCEGSFRQHIFKGSELIDTVHYAILRQEYDAPRTEP
jgi:ribosomal-protein-alanine N-acetyltransferase